MIVNDKEGKEISMIVDDAGKDADSGEFILKC